MQSLDFKQLFERLPSPHMVLDRDLRYVAANPAYERAIFLSEDQLLGRNLFELFPEGGESERRLRDSFARVLGTGETDTLSYLRYDIPLPQTQGGGFEQRYWTAVHVPLVDADGVVTHIVQNTVDVTDIVRLQQAASLPFRSIPGEVQLIERAREAEDANRYLLEESADFRRMFQQAPGFIAVLTGPEHTFTFANDAYVRLVGGRDLMGKTIREALPEIAGQGFYEMLDRVYTTGQPEGGQGARIMLQQGPGEAPRESFLDFTYEAIKDRNGAITGVFVQGADRTQAVLTQNRQRLLLDELNHRVKNTLATVQSIASQTLRSARDLGSARRDFEARIVALSNTHNLLSDRAWTDTELTQLVAQELATYGDGRFSVEGPSVVLTPKASIALAMFLNELATNALKHGALSAPSGSLTVNWRFDPDDPDTLELHWKEQGGPDAKPPSHAGFGTRIIERVVTGELSGSYHPRFEAGGFSCRITLPRHAFAKDQHARPS